MKLFFWIVAGQVVSLFGNAALRFALPLYLLRQTDSAALYGMVTALAMLPALVGMLLGGVLADRHCKARVMAGLDLAAACLSAGTAAALGYAPVVPVILLALGGLYAIQGLYQPAVRASLPLVLKDAQLVRGNAVIQIVDTVDELLGPLLGSVLLKGCGIRGLVLLCSVCFALSAFMELHLRIPRDVPQTEGKAGTGCRAALWETVQYLRQQPDLLHLAAIMAAVNLLEVPAITVGVPVVVVQTLGRSDTELGAVQALLSVGGLLGGAWAGWRAEHLQTRQGSRTLFFLCGSCAVMGALLWVPMLADVGVALCGAGFMASAVVFNVWFFAQLQQLVPQGQLGRVTSCVAVLACLTQPMGQMVYGVLLEHAAPSWVLLGAGGLGAAALTGLVHSPKKS